MFDRRQLLLAGAATLSACALPRAGAPDPAADAELRALVERLAQRSRTARPFLLRRFDATRLTPEGRVLYEALGPGIEADAALSRFTYGDNGYPYAVSHRSGLFQRASELRPSDEPRASARALARETAALVGNASRGIIPPDFVIDATLPRIEAAAARVAASPEPAHADIAEALRVQAQTLADLRPQASSEAGVWRLPNGEEFYALALQLNLGAFKDAREAHAEAVARCGALQGEADALLRGAGLTQGSVGERLVALARDARHLYAADENGKAAAIADMRTQLARINALAAPAFAGLPFAPGEIQALPASQEGGGARGRRSGLTYYVDLGDIRARPRWTLASVVHHEVSPGHILQAPLEAEANPPELQRRYANGYGEGWACYAEQLADELGAFEGDPLARIGYLQWMLFRTARIVVDTGMHVMRWSRERAIAEMTELQGQSIAFVSIEEDIGRIAAQPGAAAAQGLAALHIAGLRERTRRSTSAFDLAAFHAAMLRYGPLSPPGLEAAARASIGA